MLLCCRYLVKCITIIATPLPCNLGGACKEHTDRELSCYGGQVQQSFKPQLLFRIYFHLSVLVHFGQPYNDISAMFLFIGDIKYFTTSISKTFHVLSFTVGDLNRDLSENVRIVGSAITINFITVFLPNNECNCGRIILSKYVLRITSDQV